MARPDPQRSNATAAPVAPSPRAQRLRLRQAGLALGLMSICVALMLYASWVGQAPMTPVLWWTGFSLGGLVIAYWAIKSGWSLRYADPSLTVPQMLYAIACAAAGYGLAGPVRGAVFPVLSVILMFGMFQLKARHALWICLYALALFGASMLAMALMRPDVYRPDVEFVHFLVLAVMLPAVSLLAGRLSQIRHRLATQKQELADAVERIQALATRDELTGLLNRRHMQTLLEQETLRCQRNGRCYCIALLDIDHFKTINDAHGHAAGDAVLREFAAAAQAATRGSDVLARWGGEEFVLMLIDTRMPPAMAGLERLRARIEAMTVEHGGERIQVTVSAGLTEHRLGDNLTQTLERADKLLYQAKAKGRNRVISG